MSLPWKSELLLRLTRSACVAQVLAPWSRHVVAEAHADGAPAESLPRVLQSLRDAGPAPLPRRARLLVPDELAYLALRPACARWAAAQRDAQAHFAQTLGRPDLIVQVAAMPGQGGWLAAAIEPDDLQRWQRLLGDAGVRLAAVELALLDDLRAISARVADDAVVALLRDEGMTLLRVAGGTPVELSWERCDPRAQRLVEQRLLAFQGAILSSVPEPLWLLCPSPSQCELWQRLARGHQWNLLARGAETPVLPAEAAA